MRAWSSRTTPGKQASRILGEQPVGELDTWEESGRIAALFRAVLCGSRVLVGGMLDVS
jgi:hypothetical protein